MSASLHSITEKAIIVDERLKRTYTVIINFFYTHIGAQKYAVIYKNGKKFSTFKRLYEKRKWQEKIWKQSDLIGY